MDPQKPKLQEVDSLKLDLLYAKLKERRKTFLGYQCNHKFDYSELNRFLEFSINNAGDPFQDGHYGTNTKEIEREVLHFFADLMHLPENEYWGYVTNGGTAGNLYGMYLARELYPDAIAYFSADSHYSIAKAARVLDLRHEVIKSLPNGEMDYQNLAYHINHNPNRAAIVVANIGTTMRGAVDDVTKINQILIDNGVTRHHIHVDAALGGMLLPFLDGAPVFDFRMPISSMAISGHKMIGAPIPCGITLAKKHHVQKISKEIEYIGTVDNTISGSRNGISPLYMWYAIKSIGMDGFREMAKESVEMAKYTVERLQSIGYNASLNPYANVVVFDRPPEDIARKWQISCWNKIGHIYAMSHVTEEMIDGFVLDLKKSTGK